MIMKTYRQFLDSMTTKKFIFWLKSQREVMFHSQIGSHMLFLAYKPRNWLQHDVYIMLLTQGKLYMLYFILVYKNKNFYVKKGKL